MRIADIHSVRAPMAALMRSLHHARGRAEHGCFLLEGANTLEEAVAAGLNLRYAVVEEDKLPTYLGLLEHCAEWAVARAHVLEAASEEKTPQGIVAVAGFPAPLPLPWKGRRLLALDGLQDPGNVGAIVRLCAAAGWDGVIVGEGCADPYSPKAVRSSAGLIARVPVLRGDVAAVLAAMRGEDAALAVAVADVSGEPFYRRSPQDRLVLVIGSEARGVSGAVKALATHRWTLPMPGGAESLNAAMAAGIMVYDEVRRGMEH